MALAHLETELRSPERMGVATQAGVQRTACIYVCICIYIYTYRWIDTSIESLPPIQVSDIPILVCHNVLETWNVGEWISFYIASSMIVSGVDSRLI